MTAAKRPPILDQAVRAALVAPVVRAVPEPRAARAAARVVKAGPRLAAAARAAWRARPDGVTVPGGRIERAMRARSRRRTSAPAPSRATSLKSTSRAREALAAASHVRRARLLPARSRRRW